MKKQKPFYHNLIMLHSTIHRFLWTNFRCSNLFFLFSKRTKVFYRLQIETSQRRKPCKSRYFAVISIAGYSTPFCLCTKTGIYCKFTVFLSMLCATFRSLVIQIKPISLDFKTEEINWRFLKSFSLTLQPPSLRCRSSFKRSVEALRE